MKKLLSIILLLFFVFFLNAKEYKIIAQLQTPKIDGILNDDVWNSLEWQGNFTLFERNIGANASQNTEFAIFIDQNFIYVGLKAYDTETQKIDKQMCRHDAMSGDIVAIGFDSYYDKRTCFVFAVNAAGVKNDFVFSNDGESQDFSWDPVWEVYTHSDNLGWYAEMKIPINQLRFGKGVDVWGFNVIRYINRLNEQSSWNPMDFTQKGVVSQYGKLSGLSVIQPKHYFELSPYFMSGLKSYQPSKDNYYQNGRELLYNFGLDGKVAITNDIFLNFTINPDFGQVEADPSELNLSTYETYYSEKRQFFIENREIYDFSFSFNNDNLFYSRRIGSAPHISPNLRDGQRAWMPENSKILGAFKISGKTANGISIGIINALTSNQYAKIIDSNNVKTRELVEPLTNFFVARVQKDFNKGNTVVGAIFTNTYRKIPNSNFDVLPYLSSTAGVDFMQFFKSQKYYFQSKFVLSNVQGSKNSILELQYAPQRFMQRPDATYIKIDTNLTSLTGSYTFASFGKAGNSGLRYNLAFYYGSPKFETNELGFLQTTDYLADIFWIGYALPKSTSKINSFNINFAQWLGVDNGMNYSFLGFNINWSLQFKNLWNIYSYSEFNAPSYSRDVLRGGSAFAIPAHFFINFGFGSNQSKKFSFGSSVAYSTRMYNSYARNNLNFWFSYKPLNFVTLNFQASYNYNFDALQYLEKQNEKYFLSSINQRTLNSVFRVDVNITPEITIQYYGSPFVSSVNYFDAKQVTIPKASDYYKRFRYLDINEMNIDDYDLTFEQFRSNLVFRYEFGTGSVFYVVWSHQQTNVADNAKFEPFRNFEDLFKVYPTDVLMAKIQFKFI